MDFPIEVTKLPEGEIERHVEYGKEAIAFATEMPVETAQDMEAASGMREAIKSRSQAIMGLLDPFIKQAHALHKSYTSRRSQIIAPLEEAQKILDRKMVAWQESEDKRIAEKQRIRDEEEKLRAAEKAESDGNDALAEAIIDGQLPVTAPPVEKTKTSGVSFAQVWTYEIEDESLIPREYLIPDIKAIGAVARAQKDRCRIPGVRVFAQKSVKSARKDVVKRTF